MFRVYRRAVSRNSYLYRSHVARIIYREQDSTSQAISEMDWRFFQKTEHGRIFNEKRNGNRGRAFIQPQLYLPIIQKICGENDDAMYQRSENTLFHDFIDEQNDICSRSGFAAEL